MNSRKNWGMGKVEYLACMDAIQERLKQPCVTSRKVFDELSESGKITISYAQFCRYLTGKTGKAPVRPTRAKRKTRIAVPDTSPVSSCNSENLPAIRETDAIAAHEAQAPAESAATPLQPWHPGSFNFNSQGNKEAI